MNAGSGNHVTLRAACLDEIVNLRHAVLRAGLPRESAIFPGDDAPTTRHFAATHDHRAVCCLSFHLATWDALPAWQLRGMATAPEVRGQGLGRKLLLLAEETLLADSPLRLLWCNARVPAIGFYRSLGWRIASSPFTIATAGPHFKLVRLL